jgi:hypothetical protein
MKIRSFCQFYQGLEALLLDQITKRLRSGLRTLDFSLYQHAETDNQACSFRFTELQSVKMHRNVGNACILSVWTVGPEPND